VEKATRRGFAVAVVRSEEAGREFFNVHYTGDWMNDDELIADFMRIRSEGDATLLEVALVEWRGPHEPSLRWQRFHTWAGIPTTTEVEAAQRQALDDPSLFRHCDRCGERCNSIDIWKRVDEKTLARYRCFQILTSGQYCVQSADYYHLPEEAPEVRAFDLKLNIVCNRGQAEYVIVFYLSPFLDLPISQFV
jgi:hypothetical protein